MTYTANTESEMISEPVPPPRDGGGYFSAAEVAAYLEVSVEDFFSQAAHADLLPVEVDGQMLYAGCDVRRFLVNTGVMEGETQW